MNPVRLLVFATLPMNSDFEDPNNHAPKVTSDDGWEDDAAADQPALPTSKSNLPKRAAKKNHPDASSFEVREVVSTADASVEAPSNHVPKLNPVDAWEEEDSSVIPRKRAADEKPAGYAAKADDRDAKGVEIGLRVIERAHDQEVRGPVQRLEILEHVPKVHGQEEGALPRIVPKQIIEKQELTEEDTSVDAWHGRTPDSENWGKQRPVSVRWILICGAVLTIGVIAGVLALPHFGWKNERGARTNFSNLEIVEAPMLASGEGKISELGEGIEAKSKVLVEAFAKAATPDEVLPLVRDRGRVEKMIRERWRPMGVPASWRVPDESKWEILRTGSQEYGFLTGLLPNITPFRFYIIQEGDKALLDWEASTGFSETKFEDLSKRQGEGGIVRGYISPGDLYTFSMPESEYQCFRITSANGEISIWGYAKRKDPVAEKMAEPFVPGVIPREILTEYPMTLKLAKASPDSLPNQWVITEMVHMEWLTP